MAPQSCYWIYFYLLTLALALHWPSLYWEISIMFSQFPLNFLQTQRGIVLAIAQPMAFLVLIGTNFVITEEMLHMRIFLLWVLLLLILNFGIEFRLELMYIYLILNIGPGHFTWVKTHYRYWFFDHKVQFRFLCYIFDCISL